jgi:DNA-binding transcriptional LysR family regulator
MARSEWLRTFVAIYRTGAVTDGAGRRGISQPAASQQLAGLERAVGLPLFVRTPAGVEPTRAGEELYAQVAEPLDRIEGVLTDLDTGRVSLPPRRWRVGAGAELFEHLLVGRLATVDLPVDARFADDATLLDALVRAELDLVVTTTTPSRRIAHTTVIGTRRFVLVAAPSLAPDVPLRTTAALRRWLVDRDWVSYSDELPITRRFWQTHVGRTFDARLRLVAADLRVVARAVRAGMGVSLLPEFVCRTSLDAGHLREVFRVGDRVPPEPLFACVRPGEEDRPDLRALRGALSGSHDGSDRSPAARR